MKEHKRKKGFKIVAIILTVLILAVIVLVAGAGSMFKEEMQIISTIQKVDAAIPVYTMEIAGDYHFGEFLEQGGASSDAEVAEFLTEKISKGFYKVEAENAGAGCSVLSAVNENGDHVWGRNFDWTASVAIIVKNTPADGYASISTCEFGNITSAPDAVPEDMMNQMLAIGALYVPMDGINEAGLCVADLEVNEGGMIDVDTEKPDLTITTAIRLLLNKAATTDEAIELLNQYDIHASGGISHHLAISDANGKSVVVEFVNGENVVVEFNYVTNFNLANGDISAGGESAKKRFETLQSVYDENAGVVTTDEMKDALEAVATLEGEWITQWSVVYDGTEKKVTYWFGGEMGKPVEIIEFE